MTQRYLNKTIKIAYNIDHIKEEVIQDINDIELLSEPNYTIWLHSYAMDDIITIKTIINNNTLDDFLNKIIFNEVENNRVIDLDGVVFLNLHIFSDYRNLETETLQFIVSPNFVWCIQNSDKEYFENIKTRLLKKSGLAFRKKADYLLGLMVENIIDSYNEVLEVQTQNTIYHTSSIDIRPTPSFMQEVEDFKQKLFIIKKSALSLRDSISKIENTESIEIEEKYFNELKEQVNNVLNDIDFHMHTLESKINLLFSIQGHRLNEIMKTLTIFSVIFIPLTFIAGVYGMNFINMPELEWKNGYYYSLGLMIFIVFILIIFIKKRFQ